MRPGWGVRHPGLLAVLAASTPTAVIEPSPEQGAVPVPAGRKYCLRRISAYLGAQDIPEELITSVRCLVQAGGKVVVCTNRDGISHPWPGGKREPGETIRATAIREVHEETGWLVEEASLHQLGWLHLEYLRPQPEDHPYPHPDFCQIVLAGKAAQRTGGHAASWTDTDGYETSSQLMTVEDACQAVSGDPASRTYLPLLTTYPA